MTMIIAFTGYKGTGKSTAAAYLESKYGFVRHNFKDALIAEIKEKFPDLLREIAQASPRERLLFKTGEFTNGSIIPIDATHLTIDDLFIQKPPLMRALMQNYGTEVRRGDDPDYWTTEWMKGAVERFKKGETNLVTDDVRFINEAETIRDFGSLLNIPYEYKIIRLTRPDMLTGGDHVSETEQLQIEADHTIELEPGNFDKLYSELDEIITSCKNTK